MADQNLSGSNLLTKRSIKDKIKDESGGVNQRSSLFTDFRSKFQEGAHKMKNGVSRGRGRMIKIIKKRFKPKDEKNDENDTGKSFQKTQPPLYPQLRDSWLKVSTREIAKDIHRLIYRITVKTSGQKDILMSPAPKEERQGIQHTAQSVANLIKLLGKRMLEPEEAQRIQDICDEKLADVSEKTDLLSFNQELFVDIGETSSIVKVLRCIHQSLVLKPYGILRTVMIKDKLTKDVRGDDGWQVEITVAHEGFIQVVHVRKEQSIDMPTLAQPDAKQNHWEYQWEVSMTFDKNMEDMTQSRLSITDLILNEGMDPALEKELRHIMQDGNLIVF